MRVFVVPQVANRMRKERLPAAALCRAAREVVAGRLGAGEADLGDGLFKTRVARPGGGMDLLCLPPRPAYEAADVQRIRAASRMSQPVFARLLGVDKSSVAQWERGVKRPSGPASRLLEMLDPAKPDSPIVDVIRNLRQIAL
jgi:hypothetical protein